MSPEQYQKVKKIMLQAIELPAAEIDLFLANSCGSDEDLRNEVESLLVQDIEKSFLGSCPINDEVINPKHEKLGDHFGRIRIDKLVDRGGMGAVYLGSDTLLKRRVAVKVMSANLNMSPRRKAAFLNEAQLLSTLQHLNICQIYDFIQDEKRDVLIMEFIEGETLRAVYQKRDLKYKDKLSIAIQIAQALTVAHERGVIHHDLKPENIMLTPDQLIKVLDFGLAQKEEVETENSVIELSGTPGYMSPEQARGEQPNSASDIWSFGLVLMELFTGEKPYSKVENSLDLILKAKQAQVSITSQLAGSELNLLHKLLAPNAKDRPTAREVLNSLKLIQARPRRRFFSGLTAGFIALSLFSVWKYTSDLKQEQQKSVLAKNQAQKSRASAEKLVTFMLNDLSNSLQSVGRLDLLESVAVKASEHYAQIDIQHLRESRGESAFALIRIAEVFDRQGKKHKAIELLNQAILSLNTLLDTLPNDELVFYNLAYAEMSLAEIYKLTGDFELSLDNSAAAINKAQKLTKGLKPGMGPNENPNAEKRWYLLLKSMYLNADSNMRKGEGNIAIDILTKASELARPATEFNPNLAPNLADIEYKLCDTYYNMAEKDKVLAPCLAIMEMDRQLLENNPEDFRLYSNFAVDHMVLARVYLLLEQYDEAFKFVEKGLKHSEIITQRDPDNASSLNDHILLLTIKAKLLMRTGQQEAGLNLFRQAHELIQPLLHDKEEITFLNNAFTIYIHLGFRDKAKIIAKMLNKKGFKRRDFIAFCNEFKIEACQDKTESI